MKSIAKLTGIILIAAISFIAGYYLGSHKLIEIKKDIAGIKTEVASKTTSLEKELTELRIRMHLTDARERITEGMAEIAEKNYGTAGKDVENARELIEKAISLSGNNMISVLRPITQDLAYAEADIKRLSPEAIKRLDETKKELDRIVDTHGQASGYLPSEQGER